jgi:hypothetical protein
MKFKTEKYADVSTSHIKQKDMELLEYFADWAKENNGHNLPLYILAYKEGAIVRFSPSEIVDNIGTVLEVLLINKFSTEFIKIIGAAAKQGFSMVRFDCDGQEIDGAQKFNW